MTHFGETLLNEADKDQTNAYDPNALANIQEKVANGALTNWDLMTARNGHLINDKQFDELSKLQSKSDEFTKAGPMLNNDIATLKNGIINGAGIQVIPGIPPPQEFSNIYASALSDFMHQWQTMTPQERFRAGDPNELVSKLIEKYGNPQAMLKAKMAPAAGALGPAGGPAQTPEAKIFVGEREVPSNLNMLAEAKRLVPGSKGNWKDTKTDQIYDANGQPVK
jgi:hypothetical protein